MAAWWPWGGEANAAGEGIGVCKAVEPARCGLAWCAMAPIIAPIIAPMFCIIIAACGPALGNGSPPAAVPGPPRRARPG